MDFLCTCGLLVNVKNCQLINADTFYSYPCTLVGISSIRLSSMLSATNDFQFPDLTQPTFSSSATKHGVEHHIATTGPPVYTQARCLNPTNLTVARAEFLRMPFGLKNVAQTFQRLMDSVLQDLPFIFVYLDILIASTSRAEHMSYLRTLFERLNQHGLIINPAKCQFGLSTIDHQRWGCPPPIEGGCHRELSTPTHSQVPAGVSWHGELLPLLHP